MDKSELPLTVVFHVRIREVEARILLRATSNYEIAFHYNAAGHTEPILNTSSYFSTGSIKLFVI